MKKFWLLIICCWMLIGVAAAAPLFNSFNSGELSPLIKYRVDLDKRSMGVETMENFLVKSQGAAIRRPGTKYVTTSPMTIDFPISVYLGYYPASVSSSISKYDSTYTLDTNWATSGNWPFIVATWDFHCMARTSDGGMIVGHNAYTDANIPTYKSNFSSGSGGTIARGNSITTAGKGTANVLAIRYMTSSSGLIYWSNVVGTNFAASDVVSNGSAQLTISNTVPAYGIGHITKLDSSGEIDTTWGHNGHVVTSASYPISIAIDASDNAYIGFYNTDYEQVIKLDSDGDLQWTFGWPSSGSYVYGIEYVNGTLICAISPQSVSGTYYNIVAINATTGEINTSWGTNGYANPTGSTAASSYSIRRDSDGKLYVHHSLYAVNGVYYSITRLNADGTLDTNWGSGGRSGIDKMPVANSKYSWNNTIDFVGGILHTISHPRTTGSGYDRTTVYLSKYDENGTEKVLKTVTGLGNEPIKCLVGGGGTIYLGGNSANIEGDGASSVHYYDYSGSYLGKLNTTTSVTHAIKESTAPDGISTTATNTKIRLIPFEYSTSDAYVIEMGNQYMRFYRNGGQIAVSESDANAYAIYTPYTTDDLSTIQYVQSNDVMYLVSLNRPPQKLSRFSHTNWTIEDVDWHWGPFLDENTTTTTITPSATTGTITLTASANIFDANHVGALWQITEKAANSYTTGTLTSNTSSTTVAIEGEALLTMEGTWTGLVTLEKSLVDANSWEPVYPKLNGDAANIEYSFNETEPGYEYRVSMTNRTAGSCAYSLTAYNSNVAGCVRISAYTSATSVTATVISTLAGTAATTKWAEGAWSDYRGWPRSICLYQNRLVLAGTTYMPNVVWLSQSSDFENMRASTLDNGAIAYEVGSAKQNPILWLQDKNGIIAGTSGSVIRIASQSTTSTLTPSSIGSERQSDAGSTAIQPALTGDSIVFIDRDKRKVHDMIYDLQSDGFVSPELSMMAEHITDPCIVEMAVQNRPDNVIWMVRGDGILNSLTYNRQQQVVAWARHITDGDVESIAVIPSTSSTTSEDEVWIAVKRTIDSNTVRYIEQMQPQDWGSDPNNCWFVDSGLSYSGAATKTLTGLSHLEGEIVQAFYDGNTVATKTVVNGQIVLDVNVTAATVGLPYTSTLTTFPVEVQTGSGYSVGYKKRIPQIVACFYKTMYGQYGIVNRWQTPTLYNIPFTKWPDATIGARYAYTPYSGQIRLFINGRWDDEVAVQFKQAEPFPMNITALATKVEISEN